MALWPVQLQPWSANTFQLVEPIEVLVQLDEPLTFSFRDVNGSLMLAHLCSEGEDRLRYLVAPTSKQILSELRSGARTILSALDQPLIWLMDVGRDARVVQAWVGALDHVPPVVLPAPDVMLYAELEPLLRLRAMGTQIEPGSLPARVVKTVVGGAETAVRKLTDWVTARSHVGRPPESYRRLYQLQAQQFAFRSFEVAFRPVEAESGKPLTDPETLAALETVQHLLTRGLLWAASGDPPSSDVEECEVIYEAMKELAPAQGSPVTQVEVGGRIARALPHARTVLTKSTRQLANESVGAIRKNRPQPDYTVIVGRVGAVDRDKLTITVRASTIGGGEPKAREVTFLFLPEWIDDVLDALAAQYDIIAVGKPKIESAPPRLLSMEPLQNATSSDSDADSAQ